MPHKLLIADDSQDKIDFLKRCVTNHGPEDLRMTEMVIAKTTEQAVAAIIADPTLGAGFIDYEIPSQNGIAIIKAWREIEQREHRPPAYLCLQTREGGASLAKYIAEALKAEANEGISMLYSTENNPITVMKETLERMRTALLREAPANPT